MKNKKIMTTICSVAMAATLGLTAFAGCNKEEHSYTWTVDVEESCSAPGKRTGVCGICGDVKEETIKIDPSKHAYGDWQISMPTEQAEGKAVKVCAHNSAHTTEVTLPKITADGSGYVSSDITKAPTVLEEGTRTYVLENENGKIEVNLVLPKKEVTTVADAVLLGSSLGHTVRSTSGIYRDSASSSENKFSVEFGDNYTHVVDEGQKEQYWFSRDDKNVPFGVYVRENRIPVNAPDNDPDWEPPEGYNPDEDLDFIIQLSDPRVVEDVTESHLLGYGYSTGTNQIRGYGAEDLLAKYYSAASTARANGKAVNYEEHFIKAQNGEITVDFSYGFYENPNFARYKIEFTLYPSGAIKTLRMDSKNIRAYMIEEDADGNKLFYPNGDMVYAEEYDVDSNNSPLYEMNGKTPVISGVKTDAAGNVLLDSKGNEIPRNKPLGRDNRKYYSDDHSEVNNRTLIYNEQVLKTDADVVPENPYKSDVLYISSFDVKYGGKVIGDGGVELPSNSAVYLDIGNVLPTTATLDYDPLRLYVQTPTRDIELTSNYGDNPYSMIGSFLKDSNQIVINSRYATKSEDDFVVLVLKTYGGRCEKRIKLLFEPGAPSEINAQAYTYSDASGKPVYRWTPCSEDNHVKIYVGQTLYIRAVAADGEQGFADTSFTASVYRQEGITFENNYDFNGEKVTRVTVTKADTFNVALECVKDSSVFTSFVLEVEAPPSMGEVLNGDYETKASLNFGGVVMDIDVSVKLSYTNDWHFGYIDIESVAGNCRYRYEVGDGNKMTATYVSGVSATENNTFNFTFAINESYKIEITHFGGLREDETVVLARPRTV